MPLPKANIHTIVFIFVHHVSSQGWAVGISGGGGGEEAGDMGHKTFMRAKQGPITSWQIDGETVETVTGFIFWDSKITADGACNQEFKRRLLLGKKSMTNLDSILKSRDITLSTKVCLVKAMVFPVVMYGCESRTVKKAKH